MPSVAFVFTVVLAALFGVSAGASSPRVRDVALAGSDARPATPALLRGGIDAAKALPLNVETSLEQSSPIVPIGPIAVVSSSDDGEADGDVFAVTAEGSANCEYYGSMLDASKCAAAAARMNLTFSSKGLPPKLSLPRGCACSAHGSYRDCWYKDRDDGTSDSTVFLICEVSGDFNDKGAIAAAAAEADAAAAYTAARAAFDAATAALVEAEEVNTAAEADAAAASAAIAAKDHGYLVFPAATLVDPSRLDDRTTFVSLGPGYCLDAEGRYYVGTISETTTPEACGLHCLENFDVVGFDWSELPSGLWSEQLSGECYCQFDATSSGGSCENHAEGCGTGPMGNPSGYVSTGVNPNDLSGVECFERRYTP